MQSYSPELVEFRNFRLRSAWSKVISRGGSFDGLSDLDEIFPSVKTDLNSDRRISPSSVGKYVNVAGWVAPPSSWRSEVRGGAAPLRGYVQFMRSHKQIPDPTVVPAAALWGVGSAYGTARIERSLEAEPPPPLTSDLQLGGGGGCSKVW